MQKGQILTSNSLMDTDPPNPEYVLIKEIFPPVPLKALQTAANTRAKQMVQSET